MKVFKFGGASVKNSEAVRNVANILKMHRSNNLLVVVSAMGKTTNLLEAILNAPTTQMASEKITEFKEFHEEISINLDIKLAVTDFLNQRILEIEKAISGQDDEFKIYDQVVSQGELISTFIISEFMRAQGIKNSWLDVRRVIKTTHSHKNANVNWEKSAENIDQVNSEFSNSNLIITQGFIGSAENNDTTTLGREGSDFSAAILAYLLDAEDVTIWKDVDGMLNADPRYFNDTIKLEEVSYREAIELA